MKVIISKKSFIVMTNKQLSIAGEVCEQDLTMSEEQIINSLHLTSDINTSKGVKIIINDDEIEVEYSDEMTFDLYDVVHDIVKEAMPLVKSLIIRKRMTRFRGLRRSYS